MLLPPAMDTPDDTSRPRSIRERFPAPWNVQEVDGGYRVVSVNGRILAYIYAHSDFHAQALSHAITWPEARAIAHAIAALAKRP